MARPGRNLNRGFDPPRLIILGPSKCDSTGAERNKGSPGRVLRRSIRLLFAKEISRTGPAIYPPAPIP